jgi:NADH/F420H2 dehydrogenase subunit C
MGIINNLGTISTQEQLSTPSTILTIKNPANLVTIMSILKYHSNTRYDQLISITAIDNPESTNRFIVVYQLLSLVFKKRLIVKIVTDEITPIESLTSIYPAAGWYEREVWDLFGIYFLNNSDLRRILNDYGFEGHPFRKDFPVTGYYQVAYNEEKKRVVSERVELAQNIRIFTTI